jgi:hypothetical protein
LYKKGFGQSGKKRLYFANFRIIISLLEKYAIFASSINTRIASAFAPIYRKGWQAL